MLGFEEDVQSSDFPEVVFVAGEVVEFVRILFEVEEQLAVDLWEADQFPTIIADGALGVGGLK